MADRVLILGASGFIGSYLLESLGKKAHRLITGTFHGRVTSGLVQLDMLDVQAMCRVLEKVQPQFVVFLAGTKDVERCEKDPAYAVDLNVQVVRNYLAACTAANLKPSTLFFSTDYVFDGRHGYYGQHAHAGPKTVYGLTNFLAEKLLICSDLPGIILRVSAVMGRRGGFFRWLESSLATGQPITLFDNTYFSPTSIGRLCRFVDDCAQQALSIQGTKGMEVVHLSDGYRMTRYQFGRAVAGKLKYPLTLLRPYSADLKTTTFQADLSLLPDGLSAFQTVDEWNEMENIF